MLKSNKEVLEAAIEADVTVLACGGLGGVYPHSTNYRHISGDALALAMYHNVRLENCDYVQIHPTTLFSRRGGRSFLISESVRGDGALLNNKNGERFVDELLPRDVVSKAILANFFSSTISYSPTSLTINLILSFD